MNIGIIPVFASRAMAAWAVGFAIFVAPASAPVASTLKVALLGQQVADDAGPRSQDGSSGEKMAPALDPALSTAFLQEPSSPGNPFLVVGFYNLSQGLLAGYQSMSGKRVLLNAVWLPNGSVIATATHVNPQTGRVQTFYGPRKQGDPSTGNATFHLQFAGVDILAYLNDARQRTPGPRADAVNEFIDSEGGQAFFEAIPVLYALLETLETDSKLSALQAPLGALVTALQIATTKYGGFAHADAVLGPAHANALRNECHGQSCAFSGKHFVVHKNGLFDAMSKSKAVPTKSAAGELMGGTPAANPFSSFAANLKNGDGNCTNPGPCFGRCGVECDGQPWMGNVYTVACAAHDLCVCTWGTGACIFFDSSNTPCPGCGDLFDAAISYLGELIQMIVDWLMSISSPELPPNVINTP